jgi:hypothetical protein
METQSDEILSVFVLSNTSIREAVGMVGCVLIGNFIKCLYFLTFQLCCKTKFIFNFLLIQSLLQYEIAKSDCVIADKCKLFVLLLKCITVKLKILNCKIKLLNNTYICVCVCVYMCVCVCMYKLVLRSQLCDIV